MAIAAQECSRSDQDLRDEWQRDFQLGKHQGEFRKDEPSDADADDDRQREHEYRIHHGGTEFGFENPIFFLFNGDHFQVFGELARFFTEPDERYGVLGKQVGIGQRPPQRSAGFDVGAYPGDDVFHPARPHFLRDRLKCVIHGHATRNQHA